MQTNETVPVVSSVRAANNPDRDRVSSFAMVSVTEAIERVRQVSLAIVSQSCTVRIEKSVGRVAAADVFARFDFAKFRCSLVDGYAIAAVDRGVKQKINEIDENECIRVATGARIPATVTRVIPVEYSNVVSKTYNEEVTVALGPIPNQNLNIREPGTDFKKNDRIVIGGRPVNATEIALLASNGYETLDVFASITVGIFSTGNELVDVHDRGPNNCDGLERIFDCNRYMLMGLLEKSGCIVKDFGIVSDNPTSILRTMSAAIQTCDLVISSGGVSMGEHDYLKRVLVQDLNATIRFGRVAIKPGKPTTFATCSHAARIKPIFCLPGNPLSVFVTFHVLIVAFLRKLQGYANYELEFNDVCYDSETIVSTDREREEYHFVKLQKIDDRLVAKSCGPQASSRLLNTIDADALLVLPIDGRGLQQQQQQRTAVAKALILN